MPTTKRTPWIVLLAGLLAVAWTGIACTQSANGQPPEQTAGQILDLAGISGGLVVHLDCNDGRLTAAFCRGESFLVQGLDTNAAQVRESREHFLAAQLDDPLPWVRVATMETLAAIGPEAVGPLLRVIEQDDGSPRLRALIVLADMGPQARAAVPVLRRLPKDPAVAQRAAQANHGHPGRRIEPARPVGCADSIGFPAGRESG